MKPSQFGHQANITKSIKIKVIVSIYNQIVCSIGEVAEWPNAAVLKTVALQGALGSNPSLSVF